MRFPDGHSAIMVFFDKEGILGGAGLCGNKIELVVGRWFAGTSIRQVSLRIGSSESFPVVKICSKRKEQDSFRPSSPKYR